MHPIYWIKEAGIVVAFPRTPGITTEHSSEPKSRHWHALTVADENGLDRTLIGLCIASEDNGYSPLVGLLPADLAKSDAMRAAVSSFSDFAIENASMEEVLLSESVQKPPNEKIKSSFSKIRMRSNRPTNQARFYVGKDADKAKGELVGFASSQTQTDTPKTICGPFKLQIGAVKPSSVDLNGAVSPGFVEFTGTMDARQAARLRLLVIPRRLLSAGADPLELNTLLLNQVSFVPDPAIAEKENNPPEYWRASVPAHPRDFVIITSIAKEMSFEAKDHRAKSIFDLLAKSKTLPLKPARIILEVGLNELLSGPSSADQDGRTVTANFAREISVDDNAFQAIRGLAVSTGFETYLARELSKCADVSISRTEIGRPGRAFSDGIGWSDKNYAILSPLLATTEYMADNVAQDLADEPYRPDFCFLMGQNLPLTFDGDFQKDIRDWKRTFSDILCGRLGSNFDTEFQQISTNDAIYLAVSMLVIEGFQPLVKSWNIAPKSAVDLARAWSERTPEKFSDLSKALTRFSGLLPRFPEGNNGAIQLVRWYERPENIAKIAPEFVRIFSEDPLSLSVQTADYLIDASKTLAELTKDSPEESSMGKVWTVLNIKARHLYRRNCQLQTNTEWPEIMGELGKKLQAAADCIIYQRRKTFSEEAQKMDAANHD